MKNTLVLILAKDLVPWPGLNPRRHFDPAKHAELVASIRIRGVQQPLLVHDTGGTPLHVVAGERRLRAALELGPETSVPCLVREYSEAEALEVALIENLDRDDLSPIEEARGFRRLLEQPGMTQRKLAEKIGRTQPFISNRIRLLELPEAVLELVEQGTIEVSHARDLLLPFAHIPEAKRAKLYAGVAKEIGTAKGPLSEQTLKAAIVKHATKLSRPVTDPGYGDKDVPRFDAKLHAGMKKTPGCSCQGPRFLYGWHGRAEVRCFDDAWWDAAQAAAIAAEKEAEAAAAAKLAEQSAGTPRVMKQAAFEKTYENAWQLPRLGREPIDAQQLAGAALVVLNRPHGGPEIVCVDEKAYRKAKSAATKVRNQMLAEKKAERAAKLQKTVATAALEPWMLTEILAERPYDDLVVDVAREIGLEMRKPKKDAWNWVDGALRKLAPVDATRLFVALAIRSKAKDLTGDKLTKEVDGQVRRKFAPGITALRKRTLEAAGIDASKEIEREDIDDEVDGVDEADVACVVCGELDLAINPGIPWIVLDADAKKGVCDGCADSKEEAEQLLAEEMAA
jgi:ParB/RepB/Spo0J family partition protein